MMPSSHDVPEIELACSERLRKAREARGLTLEEVSKQLKIPIRVLRSLESGEWAKADAQVFVRGQLRSYARLLGVDLGDIPALSQARPVEPSPIVPMTYTPPLRRFAEKAMGRAVYIVITALIAVPVWMATRSHIGVPRQTATLDTASLPAESTVSGRPQPLVASMAAIAPRPKEKEPDSTGLSLRFEDESWVEIVGEDGRKIEQRLFKAGERRDLEPGTSASLVIGNAGKVEVRVGGAVQDLSPYRRADVARFKVSSDGSLAPVSE
jgi:Uncharacterized protein conserved in bacteria